MQKETVVQQLHDSIKIICYNSVVKNLWRIWAKALGEKSGKSDKEADTIARIRTFITVSHTNIHHCRQYHWNDHYTPPQYERCQL